MNRVFGKNGRGRWSIFFCTASWLVSLVTFAPAIHAEQPLTLERAISLALDHSWSAQASQADSVQTLQNYHAARAGRFPTLSLDANAFRVDDVIKVQFPFQQIELGSIENYQANVKLSLPLFTGGKISSGIAARHHQYEASLADLEAQRLEVAHQTRRAYLGLLLSQHLLNAAENSQKRVEIISKNVNNLYDVGMADSLDLFEVELAREQADQAVQGRLTDRKNAQARLLQLTGLNATDQLLLSDTLPTPDEPTSICVSGNAKIERPELIQLDRQIEASKAAVTAATAKYSPDLAAFVGYSAGKPNRDLFIKSWNDYFSVGAALSWSLNLGNKVGNERQAAEAQVNGLSLRRSQMLEAFTLQAQTACNNLEDAWQTYQSRTRELELAQQKYRLAQNKQQAGKMTVNRLLELETDLTNAEQLWRAAAVGYYLNSTEYLYAVGAESIYGGLQ